MVTTRCFTLLSVMGFALVICANCAQEGENTAEADVFLHDVADAAQSVESQDESTLPLSLKITIDELSKEECFASFPGVPDPNGFCDYPSRSRLFRFKGRLCAYIATHVDESALQWEKLRFGFKCYEVINNGTSLSYSEANDILDPDASKVSSPPREFPIATTEKGVWVGPNFIDSESGKSSKSKVLPNSGLRQLSFGDAVSSDGAPIPDGVDDAIVVRNDTHGIFECKGSEIDAPTLAAWIYPGLENGTFGERRAIDTGWDTIPLRPYGTGTLGIFPDGGAVVAFPAERVEQGAFPIDECLEERWADFPLIGRLVQNDEESYGFESLVKDPEDLKVLNQHNPMGFAKVPDGSGFLGSFSGMRGKASDSVFSHISMEGAVSFHQMNYKGNTFQLDYQRMGIDYGGIPFDLALVERDDDTLLLVHTSRTGDTFFDEVNGLYVTFLKPDGTQHTEILFGNAQPVGLINFTDDEGKIYFATASGRNASAEALGLQYKPQILIWHADGAGEIPPYTSEGYAASPIP